MENFSICKYVSLMSICCILSAFVATKLEPGSVVFASSPDEEEISVEVEPLTEEEILAHAMKTVKVESTRQRIDAETMPLVYEEATPELEVHYTEADADLLARLVQAEAGNQTHDAKVAVALTVLYRTDSSKYPDTISGNIYKPGQYTDPAGSATAETIAATKDALDMWTLLQNGHEPDGWRLPSEYIYFFGAEGHNWFYCYENGAVKFYNFPGVSTPSNIYDLYQEIVMKSGMGASEELEAMEVSEVLEVSETLDASEVSDWDLTDEEIWEDSLEVKTEVEEIAQDL